MHADQVDITVDTVAGLIRDQFPEWRHRPVRALPSHGTVNALFLLGDEIILRFPLQPNLDTELRDELVIEQDIARRVAAHVPLQVPEPLAIGEPGDGYAGSWTAYRWIPGETASEETIGDADGFARDLAASPMVSSLAVSPGIHRYAVHEPAYLLPGSPMARGSGT